MNVSWSLVAHGKGYPLPLGSHRYLTLIYTNIGIFRLRLDCKAFCDGTFTIGVDWGHLPFNKSNHPLVWKLCVRIFAHTNLEEEICVSEKVRVHFK